tara:strand:+ start:1171 stop:3843 length:2673 start_codon:yes stop_codon:yes gene_type:complete
MIIKEVNKHSIMFAKTKAFFGELKKKKSPVKTTVLALCLGVVFFSSGVVVQRTGVFGNFFIPKLNELFDYSKNYYKGFFARGENITIDIEYEDYQKLAYKRKIALNKQKLVTAKDDYVSAKIRYKDKYVKVKLRLKGDNLDHLEGEKWSFRIKVSGDNTIFGMKIFSIQHPRTRNYIYEWIFHQALKGEGILSLRYKFINVTLNGEDLGIYALEEHFDKRLIEYNKSREGPIVKFNENLYWDEKLQQEIPFNNGRSVKTSESINRNGSGEYLSSDITAFQTRKWLSDSTKYMYHKAVQLLESFRRGELKTSEVFDIHKLAIFLALTDLMGAHHDAHWQGQRFYYNPITSRLEPIGFDADGGTPIKSVCATLDMREIQIGSQAKLASKSSIPYFNFFEMIFNDTTFYLEYIKSLERVSEPAYLDKFLVKVNDELENNLNILRSEFPYFRYSKDVFYRNQKYIKTVLNPIKGMHAYFSKSFNNTLELELGNIQSMPVEVISVSYKDSVFEPFREIILPAKYPSNPVGYRNVSFTFPKDFAWSNTMISDLKVHYKILGTSRNRYESVFPWSYLDSDFVENDFIRKKPNAHNFKFLLIDEANKQIFVKPGKWNINQSLIIPKGYKVIAKEGTQLNLSNFAKILSYSSFEFLGTEEKPIIINSPDSTGQGVIVMNTNRASLLENVIFENLSAPSQSGWELTGAVTFYEAPVSIYNCKFISNRAEDALNIVRSEFTIDKSSFIQAYSDAFDADFSKGSITNCFFINSKNDAVDVSGSVVDIQNIFINAASDKGISLGENSQINASEVKIQNAEIGIASKDQSELIGRDIDISDSKIGLAVYQKKSEFGPGAMTIQGLTLEKVAIPYLVEEKSTLIVNEQIIEASQTKVKDGLLSGS